MGGGGLVKQNCFCFDLGENPKCSLQEPEPSESQRLACAGGCHLSLCMAASTLTPDGPHSATHLRIKPLL